MSKKFNYQDLTDDLTTLYKEVKKDKVNLEKATTIARVASVIIATQKAKIHSTRVDKEYKLQFFEDK